MGKDGLFVFVRNMRILFLFGIFLGCIMGFSRLSCVTCEGVLNEFGFSFVWMFVSFKVSRVVSGFVRVYLLVAEIGY